jgi:hypothetical protein
MKLLRELIGVERGLGEVAAALPDAARSVAAPVVGALQVTCSDESELECSLAFQQPPCVPRRTPKSPPGSCPVRP